MPALNLHALYAGTGTVDGFRQNISLTRAMEARFAEIRELVRDRLRSDFRALNDATADVRLQMLEKSVQSYDRAAALRLRPKFRWQGSFAYKTVNDPAHKPPQQVDLDDGVYLPTSFVNLQKPDVAAGAFFRAVENSLEPLCRQRGWTLANDTDSCVRVVLDKGSHLDLPLYAIPDDAFAEATVLAKSYHAQGMTFDGQSVKAQDRAMQVLSEEQYRSLPADQIMLAHRDGNWETSDPRKLEVWFNGKKNEHGDELRLACRYLKAWRDEQWKIPKTGPSSICLMACTVLAFDQGGPPAANRDDSALLFVASRLPRIFAGEIPNPAVDGASNLDSGWSTTKRNEFITRAQILYRQLDEASMGPSYDRAVTLLREALGARVPNDQTLVRSEAEARVLANPPRQVAAPMVARSASG